MIDKVGYHNPWLHYLTAEATGYIKKEEKSDLEVAVEPESIREIESIPSESNTRSTSEFCYDRKGMMKDKETGRYIDIKI